MTRRLFRTQNNRLHIEALRSGTVYSFEIASVIAGVSRFKLRRMLGPNGEPFYQIGRRWVVNAHDLAAFIATMREQDSR